MRRFRILKVFIALIVLGGVFLAGLLARPWVEPFARKVWHRIERIFCPPPPPPEQYPIWPVMTPEQEAQVADAVKLTFVGDLILLRDGVEFGYDATYGTFSYEEVFERVRHFWETDDLTIGVFEGPMAGTSRPWSTSDYHDMDRVPLYLNFPDAFGEAVAEAGMDVVTLANNHLLDCGVEGVMRTLELLPKQGMTAVGAYRTPDERNRIEVVEVKGLRLALLPYTYGSNYWPESAFFGEGEMRSLTRVLATPESPYLEESLHQVEADFARARESGADLIVALPHMGEQFLHAPDEMQRYWCDVFVRLGADLVLSDHPHAVQPIEWRKRGTEDVLVVHCPGNFVNSYSPYDGDASMMVEIYLSKTGGAPLAAACIPLYGYGVPGGNYQAVPTYDALTDTALWDAMSRNDQRRLREVQALVTRHALGNPILLENAEPRHFTFPGVGYVRQRVQPLELTPRQRASTLWRTLAEARSICFVGDSITEGTRNGGVGWYEPLAESLKDKTITRFAKGSMTSRYFEENVATLAAQQADVYVMAYGCNDIRYRDPARCAMTPEDFVASCERVVAGIRAQVPQARFVFVAPWRSRFYDHNWKGTEAEKWALYDAYDHALETFCKASGHLFINPNRDSDYNALFTSPTWGGVRFVDGIHPGAALGVRAYSKACLEVSP